MNPKHCNVVTSRLHRLWTWVRFGKITETVVTTDGGVVSEIEYRGRRNLRVGYWAHGRWDPQFPYQGPAPAGVGPIRWTKTLLRIVREHDKAARDTQSRFEAMEHELAEARRLMRETIKEAQASRAASAKLLNEIKGATDIAVDVQACRPHMHSIIVVGGYHGRDYIQSFRVQHDDLVELIELLRRMERTGNVKRLDAPPMFDAIALRELPSYEASRETRWPR